MMNEDMTQEQIEKLIAKGMTFDEAKKLIQEFVFNMNMPSRSGNQSPEFKWSDYKRIDEDDR